jgi:hypothetical protein
MMYGRKILWGPSLMVATTVTVWLLTTWSKIAEATAVQEETERKKNMQRRMSRGRSAEGEEESEAEQDLTSSRGDPSALAPDEMPAIPGESRYTALSSGCNPSHVAPAQSNYLSETTPDDDLEKR